MWDNTIRPRYIYLLAFTGRVVYVGQSVDPVQRIRAHRRPSGGWRLPFQPLIVDLIHGAEIDIVHREYAWRCCAAAFGWTPVTRSGLPFDMAKVHEGARQTGAKLPWPFPI